MRTAPVVRPVIRDFEGVYKEGILLLRYDWIGLKALYLIVCPDKVRQARCALGRKMRRPKLRRLRSTWTIHCDGFQ